MNNNVLLEIGTEEIPSKFMPDILKQVNVLTKDKLKSNRIEYHNVSVYGTPRRIVLNIRDIAEKQKDLSQLVRGPSKKIAFDSKGNATKAAIGFAKSNHVRVEDLVVKEQKGGEYVYAQKLEVGNDTPNVLVTVLPEIILSLNFKSSMRWGTGSMRFIRPIRWVLCLYNDSVIEFEIDGIKSGRKTRGHRFLGDGCVIVENAQEYFDKMLQQYVIVDPEERKSIIKKQVKKIAQDIDGKVPEDESLLEEIVFLTEYPTALYGTFQKEYLKLPKEVVITPMKEHQRYFPVVDQGDNLMPYFITVRNGNSEYIELVRTGNERVLKARLADAKFFYEQDQKRELDQNVEKLKGIIFQEKIGTIYDKTKRLEDISYQIAETVGLSSEQKGKVKRAAYLCKADLVTEMVNEFDELQGIMGREYALIQGEDNDVANAIYEHYLPRHSGDDLPKSIVGSILSIADKLDSIVGFFAIGIKPTGSQDPYALRRSALGFINIIVKTEMSIPLDSTIKNIVTSYNKQFDNKFDYDVVQKDVIDFLKQRIKVIMLDMNINYDIVNAVINVQFNDILDVVNKAKAIMKFRLENPGKFTEAVTAYRRVYNIASDFNGKININEQLFEKDIEEKLWDVYKVANKKMTVAISDKDYEKALEIILQTSSLINQYFDNIMVMVEQKDIKNNRLSLLSCMLKLMNNLMDVSKIVID